MNEKDLELQVLLLPSQNEVSSKYYPGRHFGPLINHIEKNCRDKILAFATPCIIIFALACVSNENTHTNTDSFAHSPAHTMHVGIDVLGEIEVDDVGDELEINASRHA